jgi:RecB family exonuclease
VHAAGLGGCTTHTLEAYRTTLDHTMTTVAAEMRPPGAGAPYDAAVERLRRHLAAMLGREAALGSTFVPTVFEERMNDPVIIGGGVVLSGQLDRLDVSPAGDHAVVVDYKRSGARFDAKGDDVMKRLQLPLYGRMAQNAALTTATAVGGLYMGMLTPTITGAVSDDAPGAPAVAGVAAARWREITEEAVEAAQEAVAGMRRGDLAPPTPDPCPPWCMCGDLWR